jgi:2-polyprenyl-3-methyl-5-hydroxy-6-metoxy-1,4-benzoquinol methylase
MNRASISDTNTEIHGAYPYEGARREMVHFVPPDAARILEIGCGRGDFGSLLKHLRRCEVWGIDISAEAAASAEKVLDRVLLGDCTQLIDEVPLHYFNTIVCNDVLEHLHDAAAFVWKMHRALCEDGLIVCSIPNVRYFTNVFRYLVRGDWAYGDSGILDKAHVRFFTEKSIRTFFHGLGFGIRELRGINPLKSWIFYLGNALALGRITDMQYLQFAVVASPRR